MGKCMGLFLGFRRNPTPGLDIADDGLTAFVNVYMLDSDLLLALAPVFIQAVE